MMNTRGLKSFVAPLSFLVLTLAVTACQKSEETKSSTVAPGQVPALTCSPEASCPPSVGQMYSHTPQGLRACTISLVQPNVILTASHCVPWENVSPDRKINGNCFVRWPGETQASAIPCSRVIRASKLKSNRESVAQTDLALIELSQPVQRPLLQVNGLDTSAFQASQSAGVVIYGSALEGDHYVLRRLACQRNDGLALERKRAPRGETLIIPGCAIKHGYSGGPIMDGQEHQVLGVVSFIDGSSTAVGTRVRASRHQGNPRQAVVTSDDGPEEHSDVPHSTRES